MNYFHVQEDLSFVDRLLLWGEHAVNLNILILTFFQSAHESQPVSLSSYYVSAIGGLAHIGESRSSSGNATYVSLRINLRKLQCLPFSQYTGPSSRGTNWVWTLSVLCVQLPILPMPSP